MRLPIAPLGFAQAVAVTPSADQNRVPPPVEKGHRLEEMSWPDAERFLTADTIVVIPRGAASKEHGPHLKLRNDLTLAEYLTRRVLDASAVVAAPALTYHHYPAFLEYPGSTSLSLNTARDLTTEVVRTLAGYGPRRFYVLNTGMSTIRALAPAAATLASEGVLVHYTDLGARLERAARGLREQEGGSHADEIDTSMMLYIDPSSVDMTKAVKDYMPSSGALRLTRQPGGPGTYSPTGIWGNPTLATRDKGRVIVESLVAGILEDIRLLRSAPLPARSSTPLEATPIRSEPPPTAIGRHETPEACSPGDERTIRGIGDVFTTHWSNGDAQRLGALWSKGGNIVHPDGVIEHGPEMITQNRARLFSRREYRLTRHPLVISMVRCLSADIAVADGKWELRGALDSTGKPLPIMEGQATLVVKRSRGWDIEAYRYTIKPPPGQVSPTLLKRPGVPDPVIK